MYNRGGKVWEPEIKYKHEVGLGLTSPVLSGALCKHGCVGSLHLIEEGVRKRIWN